MYHFSPQYRAKLTILAYLKGFKVILKEVSHFKKVISKVIYIFKQKNNKIYTKTMQNYAKTYQKPT